MATPTPRVVTDTLPAPVPEQPARGFPGHGEDAPLDLPALDAITEDQIRELLLRRNFDDWSHALAKVGNCARPVRLYGHSDTIDATTGEVIASYSSRDAPLGVTFVRCGDRRAERCPSCSRLYAADMFQLIRAGVVGGKTVPQTVAANPLVFATLTAPSFGRVHGRRDGHRACHPHTNGVPRCVHGRPRTCTTRHGADDPSLGQPLCAECYDYPSQIVWQWWAPDLWRRFTIALRRQVAKHLGVPAKRLNDVATVQYAKVAEHQARGLVHFHTLVRLDGPRTAEGFAHAPAGIDASDLARIIRHTIAAVRLTVPGVDPDDPTRTLAFGAQLDARPVRPTRRTDDPDQALSAEQVAGYLAKYATKSATDNTTADSAHHRRIRVTTRALAARARDHTANSTDHHGAREAGPYDLLGKWIHTLGFRGHFASKSRRYSVTLGALNRARRRAQALITEHRANGRHLDLAALEADLLADDHDDTTVVIGHWNYAGTGWATEGERTLALAAAARAREYDQWKAEQRRNRHIRRRRAS